MDYLSLCLICKDENDYLSEWLDYHILMGVDRFYIYDNESRVSLRETLKDYIEHGWVVVLDIPGKAMQLYAYDHCLQTFGAQTFWMGFIDTDEFLVPKTTLDLKELLKGYEAYGGLAVSSLFFGSNGHKTRPKGGQITAYTRRAHAYFKENELVKTIVQPGRVLIPNSPHDFSYEEGAWCVNEGFQRVDGQHFPNCINKVQLNHYYCRSEHEITLKMLRGRGDMNIGWSRRRFDMVNDLASYVDMSILENLEKRFQQAGIDIQGLGATGLLEKMAVMARMRRSRPPEITPPSIAANFRPEISDTETIKSQLRLEDSRRNFDEVKKLILLLIQRAPQNIINYAALSDVLLNMGDSNAAWQALSEAWQLSPNSYVVLGGMASYFLRVGNFSMAESTCRLAMVLAPHSMAVLGQLTSSLIGQGRYEEALKVGEPVIELDWQFYELPDGMGVFLVKELANYLLEKKDYAGAVRLWEIGVKCQPDDVKPLVELSKVLLLAGDKFGARQRLLQAKSLAPQNEAVLDLLRMEALAPRTKKVGTTDSISVFYKHGKRRH